MIILPIDKIKPGMVTCQGVYDLEKGLILNRGARLTRQTIERLRERQIEKLAVYTEANHKWSLPQNVIEETTRKTAIEELNDALKQFRDKGIFVLDRLNMLVFNFVEDIIKSRDALVQMTDVRTHDSYTLAHCVNVAVLSALMGILCRLPRRDIEELTLGAMLHDIGKIAIPTDILNKKTSLSESEFAEIKQHPEVSMERLRKAGCFSENIIDIAGQHHERLDGSGYPGNLQGEQINFFARIVAIADVYDALTSMRPYKKAYKPHIAYGIMSINAEKNFEGALFNRFFENVAIYPVGTILKTDSGMAIVKNVVRGKVKTPEIYLFTDENLVLRSKPLHIDLSRESGVKIEGVYDDYELYTVLSTLDYNPNILL